MEKNDKPDFAHGKICYVEIPSINVQESVDFYREVFDWEIDTRDDGSVTFFDGLGVSGMWVTDRQPSADVGTLVSIMVDNAVSALEKITSCGGKVVEPIGQHPPEIMAKFSDPAGNVWRIYQHRG